MVLSEREQQALRSLMAAEAVPGSPIPSRRTLESIAILIPCDELDVGLADSSGHVVELLKAEGATHALRLGFRNGHDHVAMLTLGRNRTTFSDRDVEMLRLIAPLLQRHLREPARRRLPAALTVQERRVLQLVAAGWSNAQIADRLSIAPSTVRKHLEHAFPKLGVTNRLAAALAFEGRQLPEPDRVSLVRSFA